MLQEGVITNIKEEDGIILLQVRKPDGTTRDPVAYGKASSDMIFAPREGDTVAFQETTEDRYVATSVISKTTNNTEEVGEGEFAFQLDEDNFVRVSKSDSGYKFIIDVADEVTISTGATVKFEGK